MITNILFNHNLIRAIIKHSQVQRFQVLVHQSLAINNIGVRFDAEVSVPCDSHEGIKGDLIFQRDVVEVDELSGGPNLKTSDHDVGEVAFDERCEVSKVSSLQQANKAG